MSSIVPEEPEKPISSRRTFSGRVVSLRVDTVRLPTGRQSSRWIVEILDVLLQGTGSRGYGQTFCASVRA